MLFFKIGPTDRREIVDMEGNHVARCGNYVDAERIVTACQAHDKLVNAVRTAKAALLDDSGDANVIDRAIAELNKALTAAGHEHED